MGIRVEKDLGGLGKLIAATEKGSAALRAIQKNIGMFWQGRIKRYFDNEGPPGFKWVQSARAKAEGGKTGVDSHNLVDSIDYKPCKLLNLELIAGTNLKYAEHFHFGTKHMVARPFMVVDKEQIGIVETIIFEGLKGILYAN